MSYKENGKKVPSPFFLSIEKRVKETYPLSSAGYTLTYMIFSCMLVCLSGWFVHVCAMGLWGGDERRVEAIEFQLVAA